MGVRKITLTSVYDIASNIVLYRLLKERPPEANISHKKMPVWWQHKAFIDSHPYTAWYLVVEKSVIYGAVYLTKQDEIGISLFKEHRGKGIAKKAIAELMRLHPRRRYLANVAPKNDVSRKLFEGLGFTHIQNTFERTDV